MIAIIDYGMGNLHSVANALKAIDCDYKITDDIDEIKNSDGIILPGVGAFPDCIYNLQKCNLIDTIKEEAKAGKPLLGICLGMQVLFEKSYEVTECSGLGLLKGEVVLMEEPNEKIPHIGWNKLEENHEDMIFTSVGHEPFVYYVHSYYVQNYDEKQLIGYSVYGNLKIPGYFRENNILGMQFHPEKSGEDGLTILKVFKEMCL